MVFGLSYSLNHYKSIHFTHAFVKGNRLGNSTKQSRSFCCRSSVSIFFSKSSNSNFTSSMSFFAFFLCPWHFLCSVATLKIADKLTIVSLSICYLKYSSTCKLTLTSSVVPGPVHLGGSRHQNWHELLAKQKSFNIMTATNLTKICISTAV